MTGTSVAGDPTPEPTAADKRFTAVARIAVGLIATWVALVAIPNAVPWAAKDDAARALADGVVVSSIVALVGLALALLRTDDWSNAGVKVGTAAVLIGIVLAGLEVANLMLLPVDAPYRATATGIGLLLLLIVSLAIAAGARTGLFEGFRLSSLTLAGTLAAVILIGVYLLLVQSMSARTGGATSDAEWTRLTSLLTGLQSLAFAAAGALLGTAVQAQVTGRVTGELQGADNATAELTNTVRDVADKAKVGQIVQLASPEAIPEILGVALDEDPAAFRIGTEDRRAHVAQLHRAAILPTNDLSASLEKSLERAQRLRRR